MRNPDECKAVYSFLTDQSIFTNCSIHYCVSFRYRIYQNRTSPSEMHLGLIAKAKKDQERKARRYVAIEAKARARLLGATVSPNRPHSASSPCSPSAHQQIPAARSPHRAYSAGAGMDRLVGEEKTDFGTPLVRPQKAQSTSKAAQKLFSAVDRIENVGALVEVQAAAISEEMRASKEGGWNSSTNDNHRVNNRTDVTRPRSAYDQRREFTPAYKQLLNNAAQQAKSRSRPKSSSGGVTNKSTGDLHVKKLVQAVDDKAADETFEHTAKAGGNFTIYDTKEVKQRSNTFMHYPAGSFRNNGDLIDFQALAVQQSVRQGNSSSSKIRSSTFSPTKPLEVFPAVENGPEWVHFQTSEKLTKTYSEQNSLRSPTRAGSGSRGGPLSPNMKKLSAMRKNVSFNEDDELSDDNNHPHQQLQQKRKPQQKPGADKGVTSSSKAPFPTLATTGNVEEEKGEPEYLTSPPNNHRLRADRPHALGELIVETDFADAGVNAMTGESEKACQSKEMKRNEELQEFTGNVSSNHPTDAEIEAMENLDDVYDGIEIKSAELDTASSVSSVEVAGEAKRAIKGIRLKSHAGLETRSCSIFHVIETAPRLIGYSASGGGILTDDAGYVIPELYEVSVFDVGYILPSSNNSIVFSPKKSRQHAEMIPDSSRTKLKLKVGTWLKTADTNELMDSEEMVCGFEGSQKIGSSTKFKPHPLVTAPSQKLSAEGLENTEHQRNPDDPFMETTVGILVEAIAKPYKPPPLPGTPPGKLNQHQTSFSDTKHVEKELVKEESGGSNANPLAREGSCGPAPKPMYHPNHYHHHHHRHNAATYAYKLVPLRELFDIAVQTNNDEMTTLVGEMLSFGYRFGQANNPHSTSPALRERRLHQSLCEEMGEAPDHVFFDDRENVTVHPCLFNMLDRNSKRGLSMLIKNNMEVLFHTDVRKVSIATKYS